jgi:hypothetical protein
MTKLLVTAVGQCVPIGDRTLMGEKISVTLKTDAGELVLTMRELIASELLKKLNGLNPSPISQLTKRA